MENQRRILIVRNDKVGDLVLATPAIKALKKSFPEGKISALVNVYAKDVLSNNPYIDKIFTEDVRGKHRGFRGIFALAGEIRKEKFDTEIGRASCRERV